jgi:hypothetical protein
MAKRNGGIIGPANTPTSSVAAGVWRLRDAFNSIKNGTWPLVRSLATNSLRFNSGSSDYLNRTLTTPTNNKIFTWSGWVKRGNIGTSSSQNLFRTAGSPSTGFRFADTGVDSNMDGIRFFFNNASSGDLSTTQKFRDVSAWYHLVFTVDTTQATASNRVKIYVNGSQITAFNTATYPSQNYNPEMNSAIVHRIGVHDTGENFDGYMSEVYFIDGQALTPSSFGASNSSGVWYPIPYTGTYGTNGFYLKFANSASLGTDSSGNNNTFTVNNLTSVDQSTDIPANNFCTLNPLYYGVNRTITEGNLKVVGTTTAWSNGGQGTIGVTAGKWYMEAKVSDSDGDTGYCFGWGDQAITYTAGVVSPPKKAYNRQNTAFYNNTTTNNTYFTSVSAGDILMCAFDLDNGKIWWGKNGTWQNSNGIANNTTYSSTTLNPSYPDTTGITIDTTGAGVYTPNSAVYNDGYVEWNFGNPPYAANSYSDGAGYGNFSYAVPSGYYALCTKNLNTYG